MSLVSQSLIFLFRKDLEQRLSPQAWSPTQVIGDAIQKVLQFFKMYRSYTANFEKAQMTLSETLRKNSAFQVYFFVCRTSD
jgi:hypothetical protein